MALPSPINSEEAMDKVLLEKISDLANRIRRRNLDMGLAAGASGSHLGPALSMVEIMAVLYGGVMRYDPKNMVGEPRDRLILSKGHGGQGLYAALAELGILTKEDIDSFQQSGSTFTTHPIMNRAKGIEFSNGSLGMGLSLGIGVALALKRKNSNSQVYVVLGDGECNEGSIWEAAMAAVHFKLDNLTAIIDRNNMQLGGDSKVIMDTGNMAGKWRAFGWDSADVPGHDIEALFATLHRSRNSNRPFAVVAHTIKGKGYAFCEGQPGWHHGMVTKSIYESAIHPESLK